VGGSSEGKKKERTWNRGERRFYKNKEKGHFQKLGGKGRGSSRNRSQSKKIWFYFKGKGAREEGLSYFGKEVGTRGRDDNGLKNSN